MAAIIKKLIENLGKQGCKRPKKQVCVCCLTCLADLRRMYADTDIVSANSACTRQGKTVANLFEFLCTST